jgi:hypothetical protein
MLDSFSPSEVNPHWARTESLRRTFEPVVSPRR